MSEFLSLTTSMNILEKMMFISCAQKGMISFLFLRISYIYTIKYDYIYSTTSPKPPHTLINMPLFQVNVLKEIPLSPVSTVHVCVDVKTFPEAWK